MSTAAVGAPTVIVPSKGRYLPPRVTVIEAGPCPVVQVKTADTDGYDAVQLAFDAGKEKPIVPAPPLVIWLRGWCQSISEW